MPSQQIIFNAIDKTDFQIINVKISQDETESLFFFQVVSIGAFFAFYVIFAPLEYIPNIPIKRWDSVYHV